MDIGAIAKGFLAGAAIAAPVGPVGLLCIHRGISSGRATAFLSGLGAATAHGTYALAAALGLSIVSGTVSTHHHLLRAVAGFFLCLLGARILFSRPVDRPAEPTGHGRAGAYASTLLLSLSSPVTMITIAAVFSGAGLPGPGGGTVTALLLASGVFLGSASWWLLLSLGVGWVSSRGVLPSMRVTNRVTGAALLAFGLYLLARTVSSP
jgi:threonine/homoserine/homoserine lactone efflux protein